MVPARWTIPKPLWWLSVILALCHIGLVWAYVDPRFVARPLGPGQVSVVRHIETLGPVWVIGFGLTAAGIVIALAWRPRHLWLAHVAGVGMTLGYAVALWTGAWFSRPTAPIMSAVLATVVAATHLVAAWVAERTVR